MSQASIEPFTTLDNSSADMSFFSPSVFESAPGESGAADTTSLASADISVLRSGSVSSGSSETPSQDTRSVHSRSGSLLNQTEGIQAGFATAFDDKSNVGPSLGVKAEQEEDWASESGKQGDIPVVLSPSLSDTNKENKFEAPPVLETSASLESNPDPFASSDVSTKEDKRTQQVAGENFFINSFAAFDASFSDHDVKSDEDNKRKEDSSSNDPFASSSGAQEKGNAFESAEGFVSETSFETAFGSEQFTPTQDSPVVVKDQTQEDSEDEKTAKDSLHQSVENSAVSFSWDNAFGETKMDTQPETTQSTVESDVQFSWKESFASEDVPETLAKSDPNTSASVSWDDAFGGGMATDKESSSQAQDAFSWDDAFGGGGMAADSSNLQFDSSAFGDAFAPSSTVEATSDVHSASEHSAQPALQPTEPDNLELGDIPSVSELNAQPVSQATLSDNPPLFDDMAFPTPSSSQFPECNTDVSGADESTDRPVLSKDPFEELTMSYSLPATKPGKIDLEETEDSSESEFSNANEDGLFAKENEPSELPSGENAKELNDVKEVDESLTHANQQSLDSDTEEEMDMKDRESDEISFMHPSELQILEPTLSISERPISPTAPPPLPPRPAFSAPPLPARPASSSSTVSAGMSPISTQMSPESPTSSSPRQGKKGSAKKTPPALPPRVDLNEKSANRKEVFPDPYGVDLFDQSFNESKGVAEVGNSDWAASWPSSQKPSSEEKSKDLSDPFSEDFFTNFDFPQKPASSTTKSDNVDPFAKNPSSELFPSAFGNQDLFAAFTPAKGNVAFDSGDPFKSDLSDSFAAFSSDDPFSDISDPFAEKGVLSDDPFGDSPTKPQSGKAFTLNEVCMLL